MGRDILASAVSQSFAVILFMYSADPSKDAAGSLPATGNAGNTGPWPGVFRAHQGQAWQCPGGPPEGHERLPQPGWGTLDTTLYVETAVDGTASWLQEWLMACSSMVSVYLRFPGEAGVSQAQQEAFVSRLVPGALSSLDEALEMDQDVQSAPHRLLNDLRSAIKDLMAHINVPGNQSGFLYLMTVCFLFSTVHFNAYCPSFIGQYCRVSALLELESLMSQQALREAFSEAELLSAKTKHQQVQEHMQQPTGGIFISWIIDFSKEVLPDKPPSTSSQPDFMPSPMPSPEPCRKHSDEEGSSEVFLTTDSDYDSSRAQSPRELDLLPPSPLSSSAPLEPRGFLRSDGSSSGGVVCPSGGGRGGGALRDSTPDVLQASEPQLGRESERGGGVRCGGERRRGPPELFDSDFILPSRQIELLHITEKRQAFCVRTSSLEFPSTTSVHHQPYSHHSHYSSPSISPQNRWHRPSSVDRCCSGERCVPQLPPARTLSEDSGTQRLNSPSPAVFRKGSHATLRVYPQYRTGLLNKTSVKVPVRG
ncbi:hypothetical protein GOODEAATRI_011092 [Goodea atripinnis]|uniref:Uncharacterized protein n=1 Tax=Goodea atripinnis TaxID=208336 RepID=A0ABV0MGV6_9TELE